MRSEKNALFFLIVGFLGHFGQYDYGLMFRFFSDAPEPIRIHITVLRATDSTYRLRLLLCQDYLRFPRPNDVPSYLFRQVKAIFGDFPASLAVLSAWLNRFRPDNRYAQEVLDTSKFQMALGVQCSRLYNVMPTLFSPWIENA
jgi:hypothetical protein